MFLQRLPPLLLPSLRATPSLGTSTKVVDCDSVAPSPHHYRDRGTAGRGGPEERNLHHSNSRESVAIFFWSELAAATAQWIRRFTSHCLGASKVGSHGLSSRRLGCVGWALSTWPSRSSTGQVCRGRQSFCTEEVQVLGACRHETLRPLLGFAADTGSISAVANHQC